MRISLLIFFLLFGTIQFAQNPGNVGTANLTAWFKPDNLTLGIVTNWTTTIPNGAGSISVSDNTAPYPIASNTPPGNTSNYNTTIEFTSNSNTAIKALQNTTSLNLLDNRNSTSQGTFFGVYYFPTFVRNNNHMMLYNELSGDAIQFRNLGTVGRFATGRGIGISTNASRDWTESHLPTIISYNGNRSGASTLTTKENSATFTGGGASQSSGQIGLHFGLMPGNANSPYNGYLNEFIFYNRDLTNLEMNKIHSYLAIKYGITLDNVGGGNQGDYISTNGTILWDASISPNYHNDVIGVGREDNQGLLQKQSHSFDDITRIYLNNLAATNAANTGVFQSDSSYVLMGHDGGLTCNTLATRNELPSSPYLNSRIEREWKVTKTNFTQNFSCDITINPCAIGVDFDTTCLALLVDDDGNFNNASVYNSSSGLTFSINGTTISVSGISALHIPNNSTRYLTLASVTFSKNLRQDTLKCEEDSIQLDAGNLGSSYLWNTGQTSQIIAPTYPGIYSVIVTSNGCSEYDTIQVFNQALEASFIGLDTAGCIPVLSNFSDLSTVGVGSITHWHWNFGNGDTSNSQNPTTNYPIPGKHTVTLTVTSDIGCEDDTVLFDYINAFDLAEANYTFIPSFGAPRDIITFVNNSSNAIAYKWLFGDGDSSSLSNPTHKYKEEGNYAITLLALSSNNCNDTLTFWIEIKSDNYFVPNSFTPGVDGKNDFWKIIGLEDSENFELIIYNRWGERVFESTEPSEEWNGTYNSELCPSGVYVWKLTFKSNGTKITEKRGHINLIR